MSTTSNTTSAERSGWRQRVGPPLPTARRVDLMVGLLCAATALGATTAAMHFFGVGLRNQGLFWLTELVTILLPGLIIARRFPVAGPFPRLSIAFVAGLGAQLLGWAIAVPAGQHWLLWVVPLLFAVAFEGSAKLLQARFPGSPDSPTAVHRLPTPWWASIGLLATWLLMLRALATGVWSITPLHGAMQWYQDMFWHVSITADAMHHMPPTDPQSAPEGVLSYHWFSNAHNAALTLASGVDINKISVVAWYVPVMIASIGLVYALATYLAKSPVAGVLAVLLLVLAPNTVVVAGLNSGAASALVWLSPSHIFAVPVGVLSAWVLILVSRQRRPSVYLIMFTAYLALLLPGTKVSLLPTLLGGAAFVGIAALIRRQGVVKLLIVGAVGGLILIGTYPQFGGGGGGSGMGLGATADQIRLWSTVARTSGVPGFDTKLLVMLALIGTYLCTLLALAARRHGAVDAARRHGAVDDVDGIDDGENDPALLIYGGMMFVAFVAMFVVRQSSMSQVYFMRGIAAVSAVFIAWGVYAAGRALVRRLGLVLGGAIMTTSAVVGLLIAQWWTGTKYFGRTTNLHHDWLVPLVLVYAFAAVVLVVTLRRRSTPFLVAGLCAGLATLGYSVEPQVDSIATTPSAGWLAKGYSAAPPLNTDEISAAKAVVKANPNGEIVATNVHCRLIVTTTRCDNRGFWVSALTQSPVYIGGWGYSASGRASTGANGLPYTLQPYYDQEAFKINESMFASPTAADALVLRRAGVRFLYADSRASAVSPELSRFGTVVFNSPTVQVLRLN